MNVGDFNGAGSARNAKGLDAKGSDEAAITRPIPREEMARDAAMAVIAARRDLARMVPQPSAETTAPSRRNS
ncbi:MAG: hypothetical protein ABNG97_07715 [Sulfitobacter sp.]|jgi:hypothetical protein|uniref:hypothetical protein n=1 Tax=Sulfitobacter sp. OXR-159 TaxID=3100174 RepID=UPI002AC8C0E0|nr:hypothetical protein [Sulfitobacter sp. OXR-159]WPZ29093.1 hypothetical protein T8A63_15910 [Sulfitobacter sp. OXR-159]|tara:strand:+ start:1295 stop:1510 length:216 start_codon:yes stop_codon:yes gene_type:complete